MAVVSLVYVEALPHAQVIAVELSWAASGDPRARIAVGPEVRDAIRTGALEPVGEFMKVEVAVSYAVFLAMYFGLDLFVTGDPTAWDPNWGILTGVYAEAEDRPVIRTN